MKKILIVIILLVVIVGGSLIFLQRGGRLQEAADGAQTKAIEASFKVFVINTMGDMANYYSDSKNPNPSYVTNRVNITKIDADFSELKAKYADYNSESFSYKIFDEKENAAVKVVDSDRGIYVCIDSLTVKPTTISADQFDKKTDCAGTVLN